MATPRLTRNLVQGMIPEGFLLAEDVNDDDLDVLATYPWSCLQLNCTNITDERLGRLCPRDRPRRRVKQLSLQEASLLSNAAVESIVWSFETVEMVTLHGCTRCNDDGLIHCADIGGLVDLHLDGWQSSGAGLAHLRNSPRLRQLALASHSQFNSDHLNLLTDLQLTALSLMYSQVRMDDLRYLLQMRGLTHLDLTGIGLDDAGLETVCEIAGLEDLKFEQTEAVTDRGFAALAKLRGSLKELIACCPLVTDAGANIVAELTGLERIRFSKAGITNQTVALLPRCTKLTSLSFEGCKGVTDDAARTLATMTGLTNLAVRGTSMTPEAIGPLRTALPNCKIRFGT